MCDTTARLAIETPEGVRYYPVVVQRQLGATLLLAIDLRGDLLYGTRRGWLDLTGTPQAGELSVFDYALKDGIVCGQGYFRPQAAAEEE